MRTTTHSTMTGRLVSSGMLPESRDGRQVRRWRGTWPGEEMGRGSKEGEMEWVREERMTLMEEEEKLIERARWG